LEAIAQNARSAIRAFREGKARHGTVDDLQQDLAGEA